MSTRNPAELRQVVMRGIRQDNSSYKINVDPAVYHRHVIQSKQSKALLNQKFINQTANMNGMGREHASVADEFVLSRKVN